MIDFQSLLTELAELPFLNRRSTTGIPSPGGPSERSECRFVCCSFVGELNPRGRRSALIEVGRAACPAVRPCPFRTFENSQQHARVIYGWIHRPTKNPKSRRHGRSPLSLCHHYNGFIIRRKFIPSFYSKLCASVSLWQNTPKLQNEPNFLCKLLSINMICGTAIFPSRLIKPIQGSRGVLCRTRLLLTFNPVKPI